MDTNYRSLENQEKFRVGIWREKELSSIVRKLDKVAKRHNLQVFGCHFGSEMWLELAEDDNTFLRLTIDRRTGKNNFGVTISADEELGL